MSLCMFYNYFVFVTAIIMKIQRTWFFMKDVSVFIASSSSCVTYLTLYDLFIKKSCFQYGKGLGTIFDAYIYIYIFFF